MTLFQQRHELTCGGEGTAYCTAHVQPTQSQSLGTFRHTASSDAALAAPAPPRWTGPWSGIGTAADPSAPPMLMTFVRPCDCLVHPPVFGLKRTLSGLAAFRISCRRPVARIASVTNATLHKHNEDAFHPASLPIPLLFSFGVACRLARVSIERLAIVSPPPAHSSLRTRQATALATLALALKPRGAVSERGFVLSVFLVFFCDFFVFPCFSYGFLNMPSGSACPPPLVGILFCVFCWFFFVSFAGFQLPQVPQRYRMSGT